MSSLGLDFEVRPSNVDEVTDPGLSPENNSLAIARAKARHVARQHPGHYVLGADTIVVLDGELLGQPRDEADALKMLQILRGRTHQVITGVVLIAPDSREYQSSCVSEVHIKDLPDDKLQSYIQTGEPMDKAGSYAIQGEGSTLVESWQGSFSNIVGLPLEALTDLFNQAGFPMPHRN